MPCPPLHVHVPCLLPGDEDYEKQLTLRERLRLYCVGLIRPEGRTKWDLFIMLLLVWVLFASPVIICFGLTVRPSSSAPRVLAGVRKAHEARHLLLSQSRFDAGVIPVAGGPAHTYASIHTHRDVP